MGGPTKFGVRGHHLTLSPVRLPPWLPREIVKKMVVRFQDILRHEIMFLMQDSNSPHGRSSIESDSGFSASSSETASSVEDSFPPNGPPSSK
jgi:hypothetical protein